MRSLYISFDAAFIAYGQVFVDNNIADHAAVYGEFGGVDVDFGYAICSYEDFAFTGQFAFDGAVNSDVAFAANFAFDEGAFSNDGTVG